MTRGSPDDNDPNDDGGAADRSPEAPPLFPASLCHRCAAHRSVETRTSRFVLCTALPVKYPRQPVGACPAYRSIATASASASGPRIRE